MVNKIKTIVEQEQGQSEKIKQEDFEQFYQTLFSSRTGDAMVPIEYSLPYPKEEFLNFLTREKEVLLHGSSKRGLEVIEPQQANDSEKRFGNKRAVYAVADSVLPIFYAIQDRSKINGAIISGAETDAETGEVKYEFRMPKAVIDAEPWTQGAVYILDRSQFTQGADDQGNLIDEWASETSVEPLAKLEVNPEDFRFLDSVEAHDQT